MKSLIIGQIHDSIIMDIDPREREAVINIVRDIMTIQLRRHWDWIIVPIDIEAELSPVDGSWAEKEKVEIIK